MTRKDFKLIASAIRNADISKSARITMATAMANALKREHPSFNYTRFYNAAMDLETALSQHESLTTFRSNNS